jgi:catechol 2,3-dioxygenase-like lactoylglutathione lyase family enzyme
MLKDARVAARIPVQDLDRARRWYAEKLGLEASEEREGGLLYRLGGCEFALFTSAGSSSGMFTQMGFSVDDIEATVADLKGRGVEFEYEGLTKVEGNYPSKGGKGEWAVWFRDCDNNMLGLGQPIR